VIRRILVLITAPLLIPAAEASTAPGTETADRSVIYAKWIEEMKTSSRGPFDAIRWFCEDGTVLPPKAFACQPHGGGHQHGRYSERTREIREAGYAVATLLAGIKPAEFVDDPGFLDTWPQMLVERYLFAADDGWIMRRAISYRGAIQEEDERDGGRRLLLELASRQEWIGTRFPSLRLGARFLPHGEQSASAQKVRQVSASLSEQDENFMRLRAKIHGAPDHQDATRVREYAAGVQDPELKQKYLDLAAEIDQVYKAEPVANATRRTADSIRNAGVRSALEEAAAALDADQSPEAEYIHTGRLLATLRDALPEVRTSEERLALLDLSIRVEDDHFRAGVAARRAARVLTRDEQLHMLRAGARAAYGTGLLKARERTEILAALDSLGDGEVTLDRYLDVLAALNRVPGWGNRNLQFHFSDAVARLEKLEPTAALFVPDQLRGSPLFAFSHVLDGLARDANRAAGVRHRLFDREIGTGFRALNPGLARGILHAELDTDDLDAIDPNGIYLLPETIAELRPIAGILTAGEGNPLSHVQLLARNLGIPNVAVDAALLEEVGSHDGQEVVLAVSGGGLVQLVAYDASWEKYFDTARQEADVIIRPDLEKLDLSLRDFVNLRDLRARDSGRIVGPKAAKLGELKHSFPEKVTEGVAIPFGLFREVVLDKPYRDSGQTVYEWMSASFRAIEALPQGSREQAEAAEALRSEVYNLILNADVGEDFRTGLQARLQEALGDDKPWRVFVRSDTNVEDLPGFTGAGLNLTLPNVVGFENILSAINRVWASPYSARAFAWRQSHMRDPENVYPAVLLLKTVDSDKSGVLVTTDIDTGDRSVLSVAVSEGPGGAVEGQATESIRVDTRDGSVRLLATATAPWRYISSPDGGLDRIRASGADVVLQPDEIRQLIELYRELPERFPPIVDDEGAPAPADIEFAFVDGQLQLLQLRPFLESRKARGSSVLSAMDAALKSTADRTIDLSQAPGNP